VELLFPIVRVVVDVFPGERMREIMEGKTVTDEAACTFITDI
jgi:hypothetical protein